MVPRRGRRSLCGGRAAFGVIVVMLMLHMVLVGRDEAGKRASASLAVAALPAPIAPCLLPPASPTMASMPRSNPVGDRAVQVTRAGQTTANGPYPVANTGIQRRLRT